MQFLLALLEHPGILISLLVFILVFIGMTYEFILRLFGKGTSNISSSQVDGDDDSEEDPPEPANVPKPDTDPDDELEGAEEIPDGAEEVEDEDGNATVEYTYTTDFDKWWKSVPKWDEGHSKKEDMIEPEEVH